MADIPSHHFIYGTCTDYITGESIVDTDDERIRQQIARLLVEERGFAKTDLEPRRTIETLFAGYFVVSTIDLVLHCDDRRCLILRYGPGSLVTRERPALAAARVLDPAYQIPYAVVTNGRDAELLRTSDGRVIATGMEAIPNRNRLQQLCAGLTFAPPPAPDRLERERRILNAFDREICCAGGPCALPGAPEG